MAIVSMRGTAVMRKETWPLLLAPVLLAPAVIVTLILYPKSESPPVPDDVASVGRPPAPLVQPMHVESTDARTPPFDGGGGQDAGASPDDEEVSGSVYQPEDEAPLLRNLTRSDVLALLESTPRGLREPAWKPGASRDVLDLTRSDLAGIDLESTDLTFVYFDGSDLKGANLRNADLRNSALPQANLAGAVLAGADLREVQMAFADLSGSDMRNVDASAVESHDGIRTVVGMYGVDLREADLRGADLTGVSILAADLRGAHLLGADLRGAIYDVDTKFPEGFDPGSRGMRQRIWTPGG